MQNSKSVVNTKINWKKYNRALGERANIFSFLPENVEEIWYNRFLTGKRGAPKTYTDKAITICLTMAEVYRLPLRQAECFLNDLFLRLNLSIRCPHYTVLSRRREHLDVKKIVYQHASNDALLVDSSGMKTSGDGEWHQEYHDVYRRKTWVKFHIGVSWQTRQILALSCTTSSIHDSQMLPELLKQAPKSITECIGDGAYDNRPCYLVAQQFGIKPTFPLRSGAVEHPEDPVLELRNQAIIAINGSADLEKTWKIDTGYHRRSLVENAFFRYKTIFGPRVSARKFVSQIVQMTLRTNILNHYMYKNR